MKTLRGTGVFLLGILLSACNIVSTKNISNEFRWKKQKFKEPVPLNLVYNPVVIKKVEKDAMFFYKLDTATLQTHFKIEQKIAETFRKRNMLLVPEAPLELVIDTILFRGYEEEVAVHTDDEYFEFLELSEKDHFVFKISGHLKKDTLKSKTIRTVNRHATEPRESYTFHGVIVKDGIHANSDKMIQNAINEFSFRVYEEIKDQSMVTHQD
ncbi:hypothetical protein [Ascidiimonas sp. W6]|uniref:hypothetical protein n=1 Tax=Ascidiimonas meishanensis TaxID=3128903 RepID=UPI0030ED50E9